MNCALRCVHSVTKMHLSLPFSLHVLTATISVGLEQKCNVNYSPKDHRFALHESSKAKKEENQNLCPSQLPFQIKLFYIRICMTLIWEKSYTISTVSMLHCWRCADISNTKCVHCTARVLFARIVCLCLIFFSCGMVQKLRMCAHLKTVLDDSTCIWPHT